MHKEAGLRAFNPPWGETSTPLAGRPQVPSNTQSIFLTVPLYMDIQGFEVGLMPVRSPLLGQS